MMQIFSHKHFDKKFKKLSPVIKKKFCERIAMFLENPFAEELNNHELNGNYQGMRSINITGDIRAIYETIDKQKIYFIAIGSHAQLHG